MMKMKMMNYYVLFVKKKEKIYFLQSVIMQYVVKIAKKNYLVQ